MFTTHRHLICIVCAALALPAMLLSPLVIAAEEANPNIAKAVVQVTVDNDDLDHEDQVTFNLLGANNRLLGRAQVQGECWDDWSVHTITITISPGVSLQELSGGTLHVHKSGKCGWAYKIGWIEAWTPGNQKFLTRTKASGRVFSGNRRGESGPADHHFPVGAE